MLHWTSLVTPLLLLVLWLMKQIKKQTYSSRASLFIIYFHSCQCIISCTVNSERWRIHTSCAAIGEMKKDQVTEMKLLSLSLSLLVWFIVLVEIGHRFDLIHHPVICDRDTLLFLFRTLALGTFFTPRWCISMRPVKWLLCFHVQTSFFLLTELSRALFLSLLRSAPSCRVSDVQVESVHHAWYISESSLTDILRAHTKYVYLRSQVKKKGKQLHWYSLMVRETPPGDNHANRARIFASQTTDKNVNTPLPLSPCASGPPSPSPLAVPTPLLIHAPLTPLAFALQTQKTINSSASWPRKKNNKSNVKTDLGYSLAVTCRDAHDAKTSELLHQVTESCCLTRDSSCYHTHSKVIKHSHQLWAEGRKNNFPPFHSYHCVILILTEFSFSSSSLSSACPGHRILVKSLAWDMSARWPNNLPNLFISRYNGVLCYIRPQMCNTICTYCGWTWISTAPRRLVKQ